MLCLCPRVSLQEHGSEEITIVNPAQFPDRGVVSEYLEPVVLGTILTPDSYTGKIMSLCLVRAARCEGQAVVRMLFRFNSHGALYFTYSIITFCCLYFFLLVWSQREARQEQWSQPVY